MVVSACEVALAIFWLWSSRPDRFHLDVQLVNQFRQLPAGWLIHHRSKVALKTAMAMSAVMLADGSLAPRRRGAATVGG